ncbi:MAG: DUF421 domain-containing protein [Elusimicrobia bacterium]|nr:DUF421 domain-containing protein [Elusimicrobiota bacterium]
MNSLWHPSIPLAELLIRAAASYAFVLLLLRVSGKRQIGQMGAAEFVALLLVSNAVQNSMNGGDNSLTGGLVLATVLVALSKAVGWASYRWRRVGHLIQGSPCLLVYKGEVVQRNLESNLIPVRELHTLLRRQGIHDLKGLHEAVLEANGSLSVLKTSDLSQHPV